MVISLIIKKLVKSLMSLNFSIIYFNILLNLIATALDKKAQSIHMHGRRLTLIWGVNLFDKRAKQCGVKKGVVREYKEL